MTTTLRPVGDTFLDSAPFRMAGTIELAHSPDQVWQALESDRMGTWMPVIDRTAWLSPRPVRPGATRSARLFRVLTLTEDFFRWDPTRHATFRVRATNLPVVRGWMEDFRLEALPGGGTRLSWIMAIDNRLLRIISPGLRVLRPLLPRLARRLMRGITTILPAAEGSRSPG